MNANYSGLSGRPRRTYLQIKQGKLFLKSDDKSSPFYDEKTVNFRNEEFTSKGLWFDELKDKITNVSLYEADFGLQINIETEKGYTLSVGYDNRYGVALMEKLVAVDINETITIKPFDFEDKGKRVQGINLIQKGEKIKSPYNKDNYKDYGFADTPTPNKKGVIGSDDWKIYFTLRNKRLKDLLEEWIDKQEFSSGEISVNEPIEKVAEIDIDETDDLPF